MTDDKNPPFFETFHKGQTISVYHMPDGQYYLFRDEELCASGVLTSIMKTLGEYLHDDMKVYIARFTSPQYREDNHILGVYLTQEAAEGAIQSSMDTDKHFHPKYPARYQQHRHYYDVDEQVILS